MVGHTPPNVRKDYLLPWILVFMESESSGLPGFDFWMGVASLLLAVYYTYRHQTKEYQV
jgi:hypothetical protein